jgi:branched-chain amino acid aminotransferase
VIKILKDEGIPFVEQLFPRDALYIADEAFMTGTAAEVTPVRELDDRQIGEGKPGPITRIVQNLFNSALRGGEARYREWLYYV